MSLHSPRQNDRAINPKKSINTVKHGDAPFKPKTETDEERLQSSSSKLIDESRRSVHFLNSALTPENSSANKVDNSTQLDFILGCLDAHNELRARHGAPPLKWDSELGKIAQAWANELTVKGKLEHQATGFGENVYWNAQMPLPSRPPEAWYAEIKDFDWDNICGQPGTGHFTQLIWKSTARVGIAFAKAPKDKGYYVVANYYPPGNVVGRYSDNVKQELHIGAALQNASLQEKEKRLGSGYDLQTDSSESVNALAELIGGVNSKQVEREPKESGMTYQFSDTNTNYSKGIETPRQSYMDNVEQELADMINSLKKDISRPRPVETTVPVAESLSGIGIKRSEAVSKIPPRGMRPTAISGGFKFRHLAQQTSVHPKPSEKAAVCQFPSTNKVQKKYPLSSIKTPSAQIESDAKTKPSPALQGTTKVKTAGRIPTLTKIPKFGSKL